MDAVHDVQKWGWVKRWERRPGLWQHSHVIDGAQWKLRAYMSKNLFSICMCWSSANVEIGVISGSLNRIKLNQLILQLNGSLNIYLWRFEDQGERAVSRKALLPWLGFRIQLILFALYAAYIDLTLLGKVFRGLDWSRKVWHVWNAPFARLGGNHVLLLGVWVLCQAQRGARVRM